MFCPIMSSQSLAPCGEEKCAWYDSEMKQCIVQNFSQTFKDLSEVATGQRIVFVREG